MGLLATGLVVCAQVCWPAGACAGEPLLPLPNRNPAAVTGSAFYEQFRALADPEREAMIFNEIRQGNVPDFLRAMKAIQVEETTHGATHKAEYYVTCDYMAIGSDADFFRMPMSAPLAQRVADLCSCTLPTRKIVNDIYVHATGKLNPCPFSPLEYVISDPSTWWLSQKAIEDECVFRNAHAGELLAGIKKDVVITPLIDVRPPPPRVAIYGWHLLDGKAIQPLSLVHRADYKDYSHGVRLVWQQMKVDDVETSVGAVLADPKLAHLLSDEGAFTRIRYPESVIASTTATLQNAAH
jgi:hypothetical protein